jgi:hypothetical protein
LLSDKLGQDSAGIAGKESFFESTVSLLAGVFTIY